jgi:glyoxylase-like metal-dependent hydrolase (beta-lactamase superfamily II)
VTRDFTVQTEPLAWIDAVALTHAHPDAIGGLAALRRWWLVNGSQEPIDIFLSEATMKAEQASRRRRCRSNDDLRRPESWHPLW